MDISSVNNSESDSVCEGPRCLMHIVAGGAQVPCTMSKWARLEIPSEEYCCVISLISDGVDVMIPR